MVKKKKKKKRNWLTKLAEINKKQYIKKVYYKI